MIVFVQIIELCYVEFHKELSLNINTTDYLYFHNKPYPDDCKLKIDGLEVIKVQANS